MRTIISAFILSMTLVSCGGYTTGTIQKGGKGISEVHRKHGSHNDIRG